MIITMAGLGSRFRTAGFQCPKYEIVVRGRSLFAWSMESLRSFIDAGCPFVFVTRLEDEAPRFIPTEAAAVGIGAHRVVELDQLTDGQATSAIRALPAVPDMDAPIAIYNIDTFVDPSHLPVNVVRGDGWIPCFPGAGSAWSFVRADNDGRAIEVREKQRISEDATVGLYYFSSMRLFVSVYEDASRDATSLEAGERYVAPLYNRLIARDLPVYIHRVPVDAVVPLGTPADVERFAVERAGV